MSEYVKRRPSLSVSSRALKLATLIVPSSTVKAVVFPRSGGSLTPATNTVAVVVSVPPMPSPTMYVKVSARVSPAPRASIAATPVGS